MCVLGILNAFDKQIYTYLFKSAKAQWGFLKFEVQNSSSEWLPKISYVKMQSICRNKNNPTKFKMTATKTQKNKPK